MPVGDHLYESGRARWRCSSGADAARTLEDQAALPIVNRVEMGQPSLAAAVHAIVVPLAQRRRGIARVRRPQRDTARAFGPTPARAEK
jgi:cytochrome c peroxidase